MGAKEVEDGETNPGVVDKRLLHDWRYLKFPFGWHRCGGDLGESIGEVSSGLYGLSG